MSTFAANTPSIHAATVLHPALVNQVQLSGSLLLISLEKLRSGCELTDFDELVLAQGEAHYDERLTIAGRRLSAAGRFLARRLQRIENACPSTRAAIE